VIYVEGGSNEDNHLRCLDGADDHAGSCG